jgi:hypothetical protein
MKIKNYSVKSQLNYFKSKTVFLYWFSWYFDLKSQKGEMHIAFLYRKYFWFLAILKITLGFDSGFLFHHINEKIICSQLGVTRNKTKRGQKHFHKDKVFFVRIPLGTQYS